MARFLAGAAVCFLLLTGAFLFWQSRAADNPSVPRAPAAAPATASLFEGSEPLQAPEASEKTREQKRFSRADKNKDGKIESEEYFAARRRNFDKLDANQDGKLSFEEYAAKAIDKFNTAGGKKGWLTEAEFATTAAPRPKHRTCSCRQQEPAADDRSD
jgi:EF hand